MVNWSFRRKYCSFSNLTTTNEFLRKNKIIVENKKIKEPLLPQCKAAL